jgi:hypothetical protein
MILINALRRINPDFSIIKEARREVLEDLMDIANARKIIEGIEAKTIKLEEFYVNVPSPFAFNMIAMGYTDLLKIDDKIEFLKRMHELVKVKIELKKGKQGKTKADEDREKEEELFDYDKFYAELEKKREAEKDEKKDALKLMAWNLKHVPMNAKEVIVDLIEGKKDAPDWFEQEIVKHAAKIKEEWPKELKDFIFKKVKV